MLPEKGKRPNVGALGSDDSPSPVCPGQAPFAGRAGFGSRCPVVEPFDEAGDHLGHNFEITT